jgi:mersacidin/lichenicidin family type 2 lantibiotic
VKKEHVIRAWRDPEFRASLSEAERADLPLHPSAMIEVADEDLARILGGADVGTDAIVPVTNTRGTAIYSYGCQCICCV